MKKFLVFLAVTALSLAALSACGKDEGKTSDSGISAGESSSSVGEDGLIGFDVPETGSVSYGQSYTLPVFVVTDTKGNVYSVTYSVTDSDGMTATITRRVIVTAADRPDTVTPEAGTVYLTFDDGPSANTEHLLDILDAYGVKATFFVTNCNEDYTWCIGEIARRGHSVGIHSATHDYNAIYQSEEAYFADLCRMQEIIFEQTGEYAKLVRFPGGSSNTVSRFNPGIMTRLTNDLNDMGYAYFDWNVSAADTASDATRYTVIENFKESVPKHDYSVVLQHDTNAFSVDAVEEILSWGIKNGYSFRALDLTSPAVHHSVAN